MSERRLTVLDDPETWVGIERGSDKVTVALILADGSEIRILYSELRAMMVAQQCELYGNRLLRGHTQLIERHDRATQPESQYVEREFPATLDS